MTRAQIGRHVERHVSRRPSAWWLALGVAVALMTFGLFHGWIP